MAVTKKLLYKDLSPICLCSVLRSHDPAVRSTNPPVPVVDWEATEDESMASSVAASTIPVAIPALAVAVPSSSVAVSALPVAAQTSSVAVPAFTVAAAAPEAAAPPPC